jgi:hypothetical protein
LTDFVCLYNYEFGLSLCKIVRSSVILLLPLFTITMPNVTAGGIFFPEVIPNSEQSYKGKVQTHNYINRQNQSTTGKL